MYYVIVDLEWNQYHNPMWTPTSRSGVIMHEEIIQIGAVKTDKNMTPVDTFNLYVRLGGRRRLDRYVKKLTGIDEHDIAGGEDFPVAAEMFAAWLQDVDAIFSWGADDRRVFLNNLAFHNLEAPACAWYDAQKIYAAQNPSHGGLALKNIADEAGVRVNLTLHDAMNDAVLTSVCMSGLDMDKGIREYSGVKKNANADAPQAVAACKTHRHSTRQGAWEEACASLLHCPACMKNMQWCGEEKGSIDRFYKNAACPEHGQYIIRGEFQGVKLQTLKLTFYEDNEAARKMVENEVNPAPSPAKKRRRRRSKKKTDAVASVNADEILTKAISYAALRHDGQTLVPGSAPYIVHPMEVTSILSTLTDDNVVLAAGMLHDVLTMCPDVTADALRSEFGDHVSELVESSSTYAVNLSGKPRPDFLADAGEEQLMLLLADMLSGLRALNRGVQTSGDAFWEAMGEDVKKQTGDYCRELLKNFDAFKGKSAYAEFEALVKALFGGKKRKSGNGKK